MALSNLSRMVFGVCAAFFIAVAVLAEGVLPLELPPVLLVLPLVPLAVTVVVVRDSMRGAPNDDAPLAARPEQPVQPVPFGADGPQGERMLAESPYATATELAGLAYARPELRPTIAANPVAPSSLLQWMVDQGEPAVIAAIAARRPAA
ncbi:hypothetical protein QQX10_11200 [Demequina sp. SYSU T00039]|uniref:Leucine rich repeat variant domain-containing protein n=1 Tax=Demequina lignilytica TaxID=3051663 RepID=A0AAW7M8W0_9MICO|nr:MULTISPECIES: hypothetical protein [unclassified Demequina]MDN4478756.1 hypothetical protein [Demequina sp. SYSU T00039-1]MDN4488733.1 hypothetical protein [Demequina sp. SYSU T00039]MDN4491659.1 hypothetical protein [Demequina sp. SYSU T00068]